MDYKQIVGWIMGGVPFEYRKPGSAACQEWEKFDLEDFADGAIADLLRQKWPAGWEFRLKPRTVKIGSREVEVPVLEPVEGQELWYWNTSCEEAMMFIPGKEEAKRGEWFASKEAAEAAYSAYTALLRGEA